MSAEDWLIVIGMCLAFGLGVYGFFSFVTNILPAYIH